MTTTTHDNRTSGSATSDAPARAAAPRTPWRPHATTLASVLTVTTSAWALNPLLAPGRWALLAFAACLLLAWGTAWLRTWLRSPFAPTLVGFAALAYGLTVAYLSPPRGLGLLPDGETLDRLGLLAEETSAMILESVAPLEMTSGLEAAAIGGICAVYLLVELCCFGLRAPTFSGVPLLVLWVPAIVIYVDISALTFLLAAVFYLTLLALATDSGPVDPEERRRRLAITGVWSVTLAVVTLVVTPVVLLAPGWGTRPLPLLGSGGPGAVLLGADLDMRQDLGRQSSEVALRYHVAPATVGALRLRTVHEFDGESWQPDSFQGDLQSPGPDDLLWPEPVAPALLDGEESRVDVEIVSLREDRLPVPVFPRTLEAPGRWAYDAARDEVRSRVRTTPGERYSFVTTASAITPELLRATRQGSPERASEYLALPTTAHAEDIAARAREVTADAGSTYDQALLLQTYLRSPPFEYQTVVPSPVTGDAVWDFLETGQGYCVQFATAMTVMARSLGIPARMGVGFLPGAAMAGAPRTFEVRGDRAHTWPELHFEGVGWVRFEPTPAVQSGLPPAYADPFANAGTGQIPEPEFPVGTAGPTAPPSPAASPGTGGGLVGGIGRAIGDTQGWVIAIGAVVLALLATGGVLAVRRIRRGGPVRHSPESAWRLLRDRLAALGITWADSATPRLAIGEARRQLVRRTGSPLTVETDAALDTLARAVEADRYSPRGAEATSEELGAAVETALSGAATAASRASAPAGR